MDLVYVPVWVQGHRSKPVPRLRAIADVAMKCEDYLEWNATNVGRMVHTFLTTFLQILVQPINLNDIDAARTTL